MSQSSSTGIQAYIRPPLNFGTFFHAQVGSELLPAPDIRICHPKEYPGLCRNKHTVIRPARDSLGILDDSEKHLGLCPNSDAVIWPAEDTPGAIRSGEDFGWHPQNPSYEKGAMRSGNVNVIEQQNGSSNHNPSINLFQSKLPPDISRPISPQDQIPDLVDPNYVWVRVPRNDQIQNPQTPSHLSSSPAISPQTASNDDYSLAGNIAIPQLDESFNAFPQRNPPALIQPHARKKRQRIASTFLRTDRKHRLVVCEDCHEEFQANLLARHRREVHERSTPFTCEGCGSRFKRQDYLRSHNEKHICANGVKKQTKKRQRSKKNNSGSKLLEHPATSVIGD